MPCDAASWDQGPSWFPQEARPVVRVAIFTGTVLQTPRPPSLPLHPCASAPSQHLFRPAHSRGLSAVKTSAFWSRSIQLPSLPFCPRPVISHTDTSGGSLHIRTSRCNITTISSLHPTKLMVPSPVVLKFLSVRTALVRDRRGRCMWNSVWWFSLSLPLSPHFF